MCLLKGTGQQNKHLRTSSTLSCLKYCSCNEGALLRLATKGFSGQKSFFFVVRGQITSAHYFLSFSTLVFLTHRLHEQVQNNTMVNRALLLCCVVGGEIKKDRATQRVRAHKRTLAPESVVHCNAEQEAGVILPVFICQAKVITPGYFSSEPFMACVFKCQ